MTTMQQPDINGELLFTLATTVALLRQQVRDKEQEIRTLEYRVTEIDRKRAQFEGWWQNASTERDELKALNKELGGMSERHRIAADELLGKYDHITLGLATLIPELEAHRDTGKTKAERIVLGHVVERLLAIHQIPRQHPNVGRFE